MTRFEIVWNILTLPCSEAARLSSESLDRTIPSHDRLAVRLHTLACRSCRRYRRQLLMIRKITIQAAGQLSTSVPALPDEARERIKRAIKDDQAQTD